MEGLDGELVLLDHFSLFPNRLFIETRHQEPFIFPHGCERARQPWGVVCSTKLLLHVELGAHVVDLVLKSGRPVEARLLHRLVHPGEEMAVTGSRRDRVVDERSALLRHVLQGPCFCDRVNRERDLVLRSS